MKTTQSSLLTVLVICSMLGSMGPATALAATAPALGAATSYAIFGKAGVTNDSAVGITHIWGDVGADASVTNLNDATQVDGTINVPAPGVEAAALSAYGSLSAQAATGALDLAGNNTVSPGVYTVGATTLNGTLTLDGPGVYIFRSSSSITTSGPAVVSLVNGADACNVFWQIPISMTIGTGSAIVGTIIAETGLISLATGASLQGRALSLISQVTLDSNQITEPTCAPLPPPPPPPPPPPVPPSPPEPTVTRTSSRSGDSNRSVAAVTVAVATPYTYTYPDIALTPIGTGEVLGVAFTPGMPTTSMPPLVYVLIDMFALMGSILLIGVLAKSAGRSSGSSF